jgi:hypothetical protein
MVPGSVRAKYEGATCNGSHNFALHFSPAVIPSNDRISKSAALQTSLGIVPWKQLLTSDRMRKDGRLKTVEGMVQVKAFR